jgi:hypothetical protein
MAASLFKWLFAGVWILGFGGIAGGGENAGRPGGAEKVARPEARHPLYISVTEINHNVKEKTLEISCKIFTNDFETVLEKLAHAKVDLSDKGAKQSTDKLIAEYVEKHLQLKVDGHPVTLQYVGSEKESEGTWCYFQASNVESVKRMDIVNTLLYDGFDQQTNIMHASVGSVRKSTRLNYPDSGADFEF